MDPSHAASRTEPPRLDVSVIDQIVRGALEEDRGSGDVTSDNVLPDDARAAGRLVAKQAGVVAGLDVFARVFALCDPASRVELLVADGAVVAPGDVIARVEGDARALLLAERTALNFLQRMSGVATRTARFVALAAGRARILDTRKTTPGLRVLEKYAVVCGGGENHRIGLWDEAMVKDNHLDLSGRSLDEVVRSLRELVGPELRITAEARDEREAVDAALGGADVVLLDNMTPAEMARVGPLVREAAATVRSADRPIELEASGGIDETTVDAVCDADVDRISIGALTHSVPALDLSLQLEPASVGGRR